MKEESETDGILKEDAAGEMKKVKIDESNMDGPLVQPGWLRKVMLRREMAEQGAPVESKGASGIIQCEVEQGASEEFKETSEESKKSSEKSEETSQGSKETSEESIEASESIQSEVEADVQNAKEDQDMQDNPEQRPSQAAKGTDSSKNKPVSVTNESKTRSQARMSEEAEIHKEMEMEVIPEEHRLRFKSIANESEDEKTPTGKV